MAVSDDDAEAHNFRWYDTTDRGWLSETIQSQAGVDGCARVPPNITCMCGSFALLVLCGLHSIEDGLDLDVQRCVQQYGVKFNVHRHI